jgi:hypothetical protein
LDSHWKSAIEGVGPQQSFSTLAPTLYVHAHKACEGGEHCEARICMNLIRRTAEQAAAFTRIRTLTDQYRFLVQADAEGWPVIPGRYGQIEWYCHGHDCAARFRGFCPVPRQFALAVYTDRPRLFEKLWVIPGVQRHQTGDHEMRAVFPPEALEQVAGVIKARRRRTLSPEAARKLGAGTAYRATSGRHTKGLEPVARRIGVKSL